MSLTRGWQARAALLLLAVLAYAARVWWMDDGRYVLYDDAFISFRYAHNLAHGYGLVFNPGQYVEGYTNFLWVILLASGIRMGGDVIWVAKAAGIVCGLGVIVLTTLLASRLVPEGGIWTVFPVLLLVATSSLARYALSGMETLMFSMWLCLALWLELGIGRWWGGMPAAVTLALASLTRPEGLLFFGMFVIAWTIERVLRGDGYIVVLRGELLRLLTFSVIYVPYFLWRYTYYGYLLPNTFYAKAGGLSIAAVGRGLRYLRDGLLIMNLPLLIWGSCVLLALKRRGVPAMLSVLAAYLAYVVIIGGDDLRVFGPRFLLIVFPWLTVLGLVGLSELASRRWQTRWPWPVIFALALLALTGGLSFFEASAYRRVVETMNRGWWTAAEWLAVHATPGSLVAVDAAGIIPYHTGLPTVDMLGLNDTHIAHLSVSTLGSGLAGHEKFDPDYVLARQPTYVSTWLDSRGRPQSAGLEQVADRLAEQYELAVVVLVRRPEPGEPTWFDLSATTYTEELHRCGYIYGIFRLRMGGSL